MTADVQTSSCTSTMTANPENLSANNAPLTEERFAILGHEIRNPLSALNFALEAWPTTMEDPQLVEDLLQIMRRQVTQLTRLCNDLLDAGKLAQDQSSIRQSDVELGQVIRNACEEIRPLIFKNGLSLSVAMDDMQVIVRGDATKLTQVFANLLHNATKFTERNGHLHISLEMDRQAAIIRLRDNGCGMCAEQVQEMFGQSDSSTSSSSTPQAASFDGMMCSGGNCNCPHPARGLGIGLRLVHSIVELHGGTIEAFSDGVGHGSTFVVKLPLARNFPADERESPSPSTEVMEEWHCNSRLPSYRIAVVDDDRSMRFLMTRLLKNLEQSVTIADCGEAALESIIQSQPQVVFMDLQMQGMNGFEVASELRKHSELNGLVLIALSGSTDAASRQLAARSGFDQYLVKPTSTAELTQALLRIGQSQ